MLVNIEFIISVVADDFVCIRIDPVLERFAVLFSSSVKRNSFILKSRLGNTVNNYGIDLIVNNIFCMNFKIFLIILVVIK